jgi:hypothetical protein
MGSIRGRLAKLEKYAAGRPVPPDDHTERVQRLLASVPQPIKEQWLMAVRQRGDHRTDPVGLDLPDGVITALLDAHRSGVWNPETQLAGGT